MVHKNKQVSSPERHPSSSAMLGSLNFRVLMCKIVVIILDFKTGATIGANPGIGSWCPWMRNYHCYLSSKHSRVLEKKYCNAFNAFIFEVPLWGYFLLLLSLLLLLIPSTNTHLNKLSLYFK